MGRVITYKGLYENSIHLEISPEGLEAHEYDIDNLPSKFNIVYCKVIDIINLFNSPKGYRVLKSAMDGNIELNMFPTDSVGVTEYEMEFLIGHESLFRKPNIHLYQTWWDKNLKFNHYIGTTIHSALDKFINTFRDLTFDEKVKEKHFLTLNNTHTPDREDLYNFYKELSESDMDKFICSFRFAGINIDSNLVEERPLHENLYGDTCVSYYKDALIEIVSESSGISTTEKSYKPLLAGIPFIHSINILDDVIYPIEYLKDIGLDTEYFGIDYSNKKNVMDKIQELLSMTPTEILDKYSSDFEKAKENKIKFYQFVDDITNKLIIK